MGLYPRTNKGHRFILVVTAMFTRYVMLMPPVSHSFWKKKFSPAGATHTESLAIMEHNSQDTCGLKQVKNGIVNCGRHLPTILVPIRRKDVIKR